MMLICVLTAIYSGDYKWFETESEEELESDSPTGTPRHRSRSPSPTAEGEPSEIKDIGNKGIILSSSKGHGFAEMTNLCVP